MVGFGVSRPEHVKKIKEAGADGVIVGSAIIDIISENLDDRDRMLQRIHEMVKLMKRQLKIDQGILMIEMAENRKRSLKNSLRGHGLQQSQ